MSQLQLVFMALNRQSYKHFEVLLAEDDDSVEMKDFVAQASHRYTFPVMHVFQPDTGFRRSQILNKAVVLAGTPTSFL